MLAHSRANTCRCMHLRIFCKIVNSMVAVPLPDYLQPNPRTYMHGHARSVCQLHTATVYYRYSFFPLASVQWNALPEDVVSSPSLAIFKAADGKLPAELKIIIWKAQGVSQLNNVVHPKHPEEEETSPNRNHIITGKQQHTN